MTLRPQSTLGQVLTPQEPRQRYGEVVSVGAGTCYVTLDGAGAPMRVVCVGGVPIVGQRVEIVDNAGTLQARVPSSGTSSARGAGLVVLGSSGAGGGSGPVYPLAHASSHSSAGSDPVTPAAIGAATGADITTAIGVHTSASDPHPQYATDVDLSTHVSASDPHPQYATDTDLASHVSASDPHPQYETVTETDARYLQLTGGSVTGTLTVQNVIPSLTDTYDIGTTLKLWRKAYISELDAVVFAKDTASLIGGLFMVPKGVGILPALLATADTTCDFGQAMTPNDFIVFRGLGQVEYLKVLTLVSGTIYNVTRDLDATGANDWPAGSVYAILGQSGNGRIEMDATTSPRLSIIQQGATYNAQTEVLRMGNLNGSFGAATDLYGIGLGDYAAGNYLSYNPTNGFVLKGGAGAVTLDADGITIVQGSIGTSQLKWKSGTAVLATIRWENTAGDENLVIASPSPSINPQYITLKTGGASIQQNAVSAGFGGWALQAALTIVGGAHTGITGGSEIVDVIWSLDRVVTHEVGNIPYQRSVVIYAPTYAFAGASTIDVAASVYIDSGPIAGTNATINNSLALWIGSGKSYFGGDVTIIGTLNSAVATGTAPLVVASTTLNTNLNADMVDGLHAATSGANAHVLATDASGNAVVSGNFSIEAGGRLKIAGSVFGSGENIFFTGTGSGSEKGVNIFFYDYASNYESLKPYSAHYVLGSSGSAFVFGKSVTSAIGNDASFTPWMILTNGNMGIWTTNPTSRLQVVGLPVYANNAAAVAGGLTAGAFYRNGANPDHLCVVH